MTGRREWVEMTLKNKTQFVGVSVVYLLLGGVVGGHLLFAGVENWNGNPDPANLPFENPLFQKLSLLSGALIFVLLAQKFWSSINGSVENRRKENLFTPSLTFGSHLKVLLCFLIPAAVAWIKQKIT